MPSAHLAVQLLLQFDLHLLWSHPVQVDDGVSDLPPDDKVQLVIIPILGLQLIQNSPYNSSYLKPHLIHTSATYVFNLCFEKKDKIMSD